MLKTVLLVVAAVLVVFFAVASMQPGNFRVVRSTQIAAPPADVFALVNDFHKWEAWSPWAKLDPKMKTTYDGSPSGPGAVYQWAGNSDVGEGRMTILETKLNELIRIKLEFLKPFAATNTAEFQFKPDANGVAVDWAMIGESNFMMKAFGLLMGGMDKMVGPDFERGLAQMKAAAEAAAKR